MGSKSSKTTDNSQHVSEANHYPGGREQVPQDNLPHNPISYPSSPNSLYASSIPQQQPMMNNQQQQETEYDMLQRPYSHQGPPGNNQSNGYYDKSGSYPPPQNSGYPAPQSGNSYDKRGSYPLPQNGGYPAPQSGISYDKRRSYPLPQDGDYPVQQSGSSYDKRGSYPLPQNGGYPQQNGSFPPPQGGSYPPPNSQNEIKKQPPKSGKSSKKSKESKKNKEGKKTSPTKAEDQRQPPPSPIEVETYGPPLPESTVQLITLPRAVFNREDFINQQREKKKPVATNGDWGQSLLVRRESHYNQKRERESYYNQRREPPSKAIPEEGRRQGDPNNNNHQRNHNHPSGRSSLSSRTESEAFQISDVESRSLNSLAQDQEVVGFVQVLPSEPFHGWKNLHRTEMGQNNYSAENMYSQSSNGSGLPDRDY